MHNDQSVLQFHSCHCSWAVLCLLSSVCIVLVSTGYCYSLLEVFAVWNVQNNYEIVVSYFCYFVLCCVIPACTFSPLMRLSSPSCLKCSAIKNCSYDKNLHNCEIIIENMFVRKTLTHTCTLTFRAYSMQWVVMLVWYVGAWLVCIMDRLHQLCTCKSEHVVIVWLNRVLSVVCYTSSYYSKVQVLTFKCKSSVRWSIQVEPENEATTFDCPHCQNTSASLYDFGTLQSRFTLNAITSVFVDFTQSSVRKKTSQKWKEALLGILLESSGLVMKNQLQTCTHTSVS